MNDSNPATVQSVASKNLVKNDTTDISYRFKAGIFLTCITGISAVAAFAFTVASAKKKDPKMFEKGVMITKELEETGVELAMRALKWGTFYSVSGCSLIAYAIWKLSGAKTMDEFKMKAGNFLPRIPKREITQGRTEFSGLNDLLTYISKDYDDDFELKN